MGYRLSKIYTRTGDDGTTGIGGGTRVSKDCIQIDAIGDIDELNALIGCVLAERLDPDCSMLLSTIQHHLFDLGGELAYPEYQGLQQQSVDWLERWIDFFNQQLKPLEDFILPSGSRAVVLTHLARTVCRRAERSLVRWAHEHAVRSVITAYVNRLSDVLFVISRILQQRHHDSTTLWRKQVALPEPGSISCD